MNILHSSDSKLPSVELKEHAMSKNFVAVSAEKGLKDEQALFVLREIADFFNEAAELDNQ
jgi:hypothetical protein